MARTDFNKIVKCLHPDRYQDPAEKRGHEEALQAFNALKTAGLINVS
jgi:hypothetical protein